MNEKAAQVVKDVNRLMDAKIAAGHREFSITLTKRQLSLLQKHGDDHSVAALRSRAQEHGVKFLQQRE